MKRRLVNLLKDDEFLASVFALLFTLFIVALSILIYNRLITNRKVIETVPKISKETTLFINNFGENKNG